MYFGQLAFPQSNNIDPTAYHYETNLFSPSEIDWLLKSHENIPFELGKIVNKEEEEHEIRKSQIKWFQPSIYPEFDWVYNRLQIAIERSNKNWNFSLYTMPEPIQYTEYTLGGGHYDWHMDVGPGERMSCRKISITVQLSSPEEYEGGYLQFLRRPEPENAPKDLGAVVVFPSYMMHRVTPITKGIRKSLVLWVGGEPYR